MGRRVVFTVADWCCALLQERYTVTTTAQYGGAACPEIHGALRRILPCNNSTPCPVNCTYYWDQYNSCTGACNNGSGQLPERLVITSIALHGGYCPGSNGEPSMPLHVSVDTAWQCVRDSRTNSFDFLCRQQFSVLWPLCHVLAIQPLVAAAF